MFTLAKRLGAFSAVAMSFLACHENLNGPATGNTAPTLPAAGQSVTETVSAQGVANAQLGESRVEFTVLDTKGSPLADATASVHLGDSWLLIGLHDVQGRVPPAMTAVSTSLFTNPAVSLSYEGASARRKAITVSHQAPGVVSVIASLETSGVAVRESDLSDDLLVEMEADGQLNMSCDQEFDIDAELQAVSAGGQFLSFGASGVELAFSANANIDDVVNALQSQTEAVATDVVQGCEVSFGDGGSGFRTFVGRTVEFGGIYAHTGQIFTGDPTSTLYLVEVDANGQDIMLGPVVTPDGRGLNLLDITRAPSDVLATGPAILGIEGSRLYKVSRANGGAVLHREFNASAGVNGLAFDGSTVYGSSAAGWLMQVLPVPVNIDSMIRVGQFDAQGLVSAGDIAFSPTTGELYAVLAETPDRTANQNFLARIDRNTGAATIIGDISPPGFTGWYDEVWGLTFFRGELYGLTSLPGQLIKIDPQTAAAEKVRDLTFNATGAGDPIPN